MEEILIKTIEKKIQDLEETKLDKIEQMKKEQKLDVANIKLTKYKEDALAEIANDGAGKEEASADLEKIEKELEKIKIAETDIVEKVENEIKMTKRNLTEATKMIAEKEKKQKENEDIDKDIKKLLKNKEDALEEIENNGEGSKEATADLEKIEAELEKKYKIKEKNEKVIEQANKKIDEFIKKYDVKKILEEKMNSNVEEAVQENAEFDNKHTETTPNLDTKQAEEKDKNTHKEENHKEMQTMHAENNIKTQIVLNVDKNEIKINETDEFRYRKETKNKKELIQDLAINSYFINDKKAKRNIDYALLSILRKIDDKNDTLVMAYLDVISGGKLLGKGIEESVKLLNQFVDVQYKFDKNIGILNNLRAKRVARNAKALGIASLEGISEKGFFDNVKGIFSKLKNVKLLKGIEEVKALESGEKTNAQKDKNKTKQLINEDRENFKKKSNEKEESTSKEFQTRYEADDKVKQDMDDIIKRYQEEEKKAEETRIKDVERIKAEAKIKEDTDNMAKKDEEEMKVEQIISEHLAKNEYSKMKALEFTKYMEKIKAAEIRIKNQESKETIYKVTPDEYEEIPPKRSFSTKYRTDEKTQQKIDAKVKEHKENAYRLAPDEYEEIPPNHDFNIDKD